MRYLAFLLIILCALPLSAAAVPRADLESVRVCPAAAVSQPPDFGAAACETLPLWRADPTRRQIWIAIPLSMAAEDLTGREPLGIYVSGRAASEVYLNGARLGANGRPAANADEEIPGRIDAALFAPRDLFRPGENIIAMRLSAHHGLLRLAAPMQWVSVRAYGDPTRDIFAYYWPALLVFASFVIGAGVFAVSAWRGPARRLSAANAAMAGFAGAQLLAETARGLIAYPYPLHDLRLIAITVFAAGFGLSLLAHVLIRFGPFAEKLRYGVVACGALVLLGAALVNTGFDNKTIYVLCAAALMACAVCVWAGVKGRRFAWLYAGGLGAAAIAAVMMGSAFLNIWFYFMSGGFILALVIEQSFALARERRERLSETRRAHELGVALARAKQAAQPEKLQFVSAGRVVYVGTDEITQLNAAGDYVETVFADGRTILYNGPLAALEETLPAIFIRVHRSHIVNADFVQSLERDPGGAGRLILTTGAAIPISRRIMPAVRSALAEGAV